MKKEEEEDLKKALSDYENLQKQLEVLLIQKHQLQLQLNEVKHAHTELKKAKGDVYRSIGSVMIHTTREEADKDLGEKQELLQVKIDALTKQEEKLRETVTSSQAELKKRLKKD